MNATVYTEPQSELDAKIKGPILGHVHEELPIGTHKYPYFATKEEPDSPNTILCLQKFLGSGMWFRWPKYMIHSMVIEIALCEQNHIVLRPNQLYILRVMPNCEECKKIAENYKMVDNT